MHHVGIFQYTIVHHVGISQYTIVHHVGISQYTTMHHVGIFQYTTIHHVGISQYTTIHHVGIFQYTTVLQYSSSLHTTLLCSIIPSTRSCRSCGALAFSSILHSPASTEVVGNEEIGEGRWRNSRITIMADAGLQWLTYISTMAASTCVVI